MAMRAPRVKRRRVWSVLIVLLIIAVAPSYVRAYRVAGNSDAPSYLLGDLILVNQIAYDLRLPYLDIVVLSHSEPRPGDVVHYLPPDRTYPVIKRVVGSPGDTIAMQDYHLTINGEPLQYEPAVWMPDDHVMDANPIGAVVEQERGNGPAHLITYTPCAIDRGDFDPVTVPEGHYFVLGDNRGNSRDPRVYGAIPRETILGRVGRPLRALHRSGPPGPATTLRSISRPRSSWRRPDQTAACSRDGGS